MSEMRFFVDKRNGCIAVRDRHETDPKYNGLHHDTPGVLFFRMGSCESGEWTIHPADEAEANLQCARLNMLNAAAAPRPVHVYLELDEYLGWSIHGRATGDQLERLLGKPPWSGMAVNITAVETPKKQEAGE